MKFARDTFPFLNDRLRAYPVFLIMFCLQNLKSHSHIVDEICQLRDFIPGIPAGGNARGKIAFTQSNQCAMDYVHPAHKKPLDQQIGQKD
jgi:hypothetical protein